MKKQINELNIPQKTLEEIHNGIKENIEELKIIKLELINEFDGIADLELQKIINCMKSNIR